MFMPTRKCAQSNPCYAVLPLGRKFPFLRKFQPSEGNQKEIEFRRKKKEI